MKEQKEEQKIKAASYCRVSTPGQVDRISLDDQKKRIEEYCKNNVWPLVDVYVDKGISGSTDDRPEFRRMLADAAQGKFNALVVVDNSRFGRNIEDRIRIRETLVREFGLKLYSLKEGPFKDDPTGRFQDNIIASTNQYQIETLKEKSISALMYKLEVKGERNIGHLLYGLKWRKDKKSAEHHPEEYPKLRLIINLRLKLKWSCQKIADFLNGKFCDEKGLRISRKLGVTLPTIYCKGRKKIKDENGVDEVVIVDIPWDYHKVSYICSLNLKKYSFGEGSINPKKYAEGSFGYSFPPVISESELIELRKIRPDYIVDGRQRPVYLLSGKLVCNLCGEKLHHLIIANKYKGKRKEWHYYACKNKLEGTKGKRCQLRSIPQEWIEKWVWYYLKEFFNDQKGFERIIFANNLELSEDHKNLNEIANRLVELDKLLEDNHSKIERIIDAIALGEEETYTKDLMNQRIKSIDKERSRLKEEQEQLEFKQSFLCKKVGAVSRLEQTRRWWFKYSQKLTKEQMKDIIDTVVEKIEVYPCEPWIPPNASPRLKAVHKEIMKIKEPKVGFEIIGKVPLVEKTFYRSDKVDIRQAAALYCNRASAGR